MQARLIAILIAAAIAFITIAISVRVRPLKHVLFGGHVGTAHAAKAG